MNEYSSTYRMGCGFIRQKKVKNFGLQLSPPPDNLALNIFLVPVYVLLFLVMAGLLFLLAILVFAFLVSC